MSLGSNCYLSFDLWVSDTFSQHHSGMVRGNVKLPNNPLSDGLRVKVSTQEEGLPRAREFLWEWWVLKLDSEEGYKLGEYTKNQWIAHFQRASVIICELCPIKLFLKNIPGMYIALCNSSTAAATPVRCASRRHHRTFLNFCWTPGAWSHFRDWLLFSPTPMYTRFPFTGFLNIHLTIAAKGNKH